jgi:hypothetical protein
LTTSDSILATEAIKCQVDSNQPQASDLIPLIRRRNCLRGALNRMLFKSISRSLVSDVRFATGIAVTSIRAGSDGIAGNGSPKAVFTSALASRRAGLTLCLLCWREKQGRQYQ